jgi:protein gp37
MVNMPRLSPSGIEYLDYAWGFYSGCENWHNGVCPVGNKCWAKRTTERFKSHYPNGFKPMYYPEAFLSPLMLKKPSRIGAAWMGDLFGLWNDPERLFLFEDGYNTIRQIIFFVIKQCSQHTFFFLTKCPENLPKWSPFPSNVKVGVTATDHLSFAAAYYWLDQIEAGGKYISLEPFYNWDIRATDGFLYQAKQAGVEWLPIGAQTNPYLPPKIEWLEVVVIVAEKASIGIFLKDNIRPLIREAVWPKWSMDDRGDLRQELPK